MAQNSYLTSIVQNLANGTLSFNLCLVCLNELEEDKSESVFTKICKEDREYCIADVLETVCQIKIQGLDHYNICLDCFQLASTAYKFYLKVKRSHEILNHYTEEILSSLENVHLTDSLDDNLLFVPLPSYEPPTKEFDYDLKGIGQYNFYEEDSLIPEVTPEEKYIVCVEDGVKMVFKLQNDGSLVEVESNKSTDEDVEEAVDQNKVKVRKKRDPMTYLSCSQCPIKYRFVAKLKDHMKNTHGINLYYCKICKITTESKQEYDDHLATHKGEHQCTICNNVYKKHETLVAHIKTHDKTVQQTDNSDICEVCGVLVEPWRLAEHARRHAQRFTCYYCGRRYKGEGSFDAHIRKHEEMQHSAGAPGPARAPAAPRARPACATCGASFVDERALRWHRRLHAGERPYACQVCGLRFVSRARREAHALTAHTRPRRRCPLCPALFHLRSIVNTHLKKVHLKAHKRRNRVNKYSRVYWPTSPVPIQDLSVSIQHQILEMKTAQETDENQENPSSFKP